MWGENKGKIKTRILETIRVWHPKPS